jgi:hypothetical protein
LDHSGSVDTFRITLSENITSCAYNFADWQMVAGADFNPQFIGLTCLGNVLDLKVLSTGNITGNSTQPSISYTNHGKIILTSGPLADLPNITVVDGVGPRIVSTTPVNGATVLSLTANVVINFSETMDVNSLVARDSRLGDAEYVQKWDSLHKQVTLSHNKPWEDNVTVRFEVLAAKDVAGNDFEISDVPNPWNFQVPATTGSSARPLGAISINAGDSVTATREVAIDVAYLNANEIVLSEAPDLNGASYQSITPKINFTLSQGSSVKTIYARIRGNSGITEILSDSINYAPTVPEVVTPVEKPTSTLGIELDSLIKGVAPTVYYYAKNGHRYVFPDEKTMKSWYGGAAVIKTLSDTQLSQIVLGGVVTYRPGSLVKINTDPKVYAVGANGELHWVETELLARTLYGDNWALQISDLLDVYFPSYKIGSSIKSPNDFNPIATQNLYQNISQSLGL